MAHFLKKLKTNGLGKAKIKKSAYKRFKNENPVNSFVDHDEGCICPSGKLLCV